MRGGGERRGMSSGEDKDLGVRGSTHLSRFVDEVLFTLPARRSARWFFRENGSVSKDACKVMPSLLTKAD